MGGHETGGVLGAKLGGLCPRPEPKIAIAGILHCCLSWLHNNLN